MTHLGPASPSTAPTMPAASSVPRPGALPSTDRGFWARVGAFLLAPLRPFADPSADLATVLLWPFLTVALACDQLVPRQRVWLDGTVVRTGRAGRTRAVDLATATSVGLVTKLPASFDTGVALKATGAGGTVCVPVYVDAVGRRRTLPSGALRGLARAVAANPALPALQVVALLEQQADHQDAGRTGGTDELRALARGSSDLVADVDPSRCKAPAPPASRPARTARSLD